MDTTTILKFSHSTSNCL